MSTGTLTYPYWDSFNRYIVSGLSGKQTVFAQLYLHPSSYYQARCYGSHPTCPHKLGPYFSLSEAQSAIQSHCQHIHYIVPPGSGPPVAPIVPEILSINPSVGVKNTAFTLTLNGVAFTASNLIYFDGNAQSGTVFINSRQLTCPISATQVPAARPYSVMVVDPTAGQSNVMSFTATPS